MISRRLPVIAFSSAVSTAFLMLWLSTGSVPALRGLILTCIVQVALAITPRRRREMPQFVEAPPAGAEYQPQLEELLASLRE